MFYGGLFEALLHCKSLEWFQGLGLLGILLHPRPEAFKRKMSHNSLPYQREKVLSKAAKIIAVVNDGV
ncbi:hypothetical protein DRN39_01455 [Thermococci archaeon]|nr:MAG: hypothetical protein DRN39_01455 [Thermococci archaeon]